MLKTISFGIYYLFVHFGSIYTYTKLLHMRLTKKEYFRALLFSIPVAVILSFIHKNIRPLTIYSAILCVFLYVRFFLKTPFQKVSVNICISMLSFSMNFIFSVLLVLVVEPIFYYAIPNYTNSPFFVFISSLLQDILLILLLVLLFRIPRIRRGIPDIEKNISDETGFLIGIPLLFILSVFSLDGSAAFIVFFTTFLLLTLGLLLFFWWRKYVSHNYIHKAQNQTIKILENTILEQTEELERLSKIIHKDNKLIGALYLSVQKLCETVQTEQSRQLQKELAVLFEERKGILHHYETGNETLPKTGVFSTDVILSYLSKRALEKDISFDVSITGDIKYLTECLLEETLFNTLLADLGENAIIATSDAEHRTILLSMGIREGTYFIDFFDSGAAFDAAVISNLGKRRYTTHKAEGGSGIGLMTALEIIREKKASFEIEEFSEPAPFTKRVSIVFDSCAQTRINKNLP